MIKHVARVGALCGALIWAGSALAAPTAGPDREVQDLAAAIAQAASTAEASATPDGTAKAVETSVQEVIVVAAQPPLVVRNALQRVMSVCIRGSEVERSGITCPGNPASYAALRTVLGIVVTMLEDSTAAVDSPVTFSTLPLPIPGGGGSDYRRVP